MKLSTPAVDPRGSGTIVEGTTVTQRISTWMNAARGVSASSSAFAAVVALLAGAGLVAAAGANPAQAARSLLSGAFGSEFSIANTLVESVPLILVGVGVAVAFRAGIFNIGGEGQLYVGGLAAAAVGLQLGTLPAVAVLPLMGLAGASAGAAWSLIAGVLRVWRGASEVINTIMLNYIGIYLVQYFLHGPLQAPGVTSFGETDALSRAARLPSILAGTGLHAGFILAIVAAVAFHAVLFGSTWGYRVRLIGANPRAALSNGIGVTPTVLWVFACSGALAGLAGFCAVSGVQGRMIDNISPGYGYVAIVVALLGGNLPLGVVVAGIFMASLDTGSITMQSVAGVPSAVGQCIQYLVVILVIARAALNPTLVRRRARKVVAA